MSDSLRKHTKHTRQRECFSMSLVQLSKRRRPLLGCSAHFNVESVFNRQPPNLGPINIGASFPSRGEPKGSMLQKSLCARRVCFFWLCAVKLHGRGERQRPRDLLQPAPVNQSQPIKSLVGFISSHSHLWLKAAEVEAVTPAGRTYQRGNSSRMAFFFFLSCLSTAGCRLWSWNSDHKLGSEKCLHIGLTERDIEKGIKKKVKMPFGVWNLRSFVWKSIGLNADWVWKATVYLSKIMKRLLFNPSKHLTDKRQWFLEQWRH